MPTPDELLQKLEERFILGEITEDTYKEIKARILARQTGQPAGGPTSVSDSVVKGDVGSTKGAASVGSVNINVPGLGAARAAGPALVVCPLCGRRNTLDAVFRCRKCGTDHLCLEHFVDEVRMCEECVEQDAEARRRLEEQRKKQKEEREAAEKAKQKPREAPRPTLQVYKKWPFDPAEAKRRQEETAAALGVPVEKHVDLGGGVKLTLVLIPAGEFDMGSPEGEEERYSDEVLHRVRITRPFYIGKYPVTQEQWQAVTGGNPSYFKGAENPVEQVSWHDCQGFTEELNYRLGSGRFALPTEAHWEYACRAGSHMRFCFGRSSSNLGNYAWYEDNSGGKTHPVGQKRPNAWGLYDVHGNVWEWCADWYGEYPTSDAEDPRGPSSGDNRVLRGGSWRHVPLYLRSASRLAREPSDSYHLLGVRVVCALQE